MIEKKDDGSFKSDSASEGGRLSTGGPEMTGSGAGTLIGDNMGMSEDPFSGRHNMFGQSDKPAGRRSVNL